MTVLESKSREELLREYGRWYGQQHFAIAFTSTTEGDDAKRVTQRGWDKTTPLADGDYGEALIYGRGQKRNPVIVVRPSNLVILECDTEIDLANISQLDLPETVTVVSSEPYKRHFYFRPDPELEQLPAVAFRFESERITQDTGRYFLCPPAIHPSGRIYSFLAQHGPSDLPLAVLPAAKYRDLIAAAHHDIAEEGDAIQFDPNAKISAGRRREFLFRYACMLRRWGHSQPEIERMCNEINEARCDPPVARNFVRVQVEGAMKKQGNQELAQQEDEPERTIAPVSARSLCSERDSEVPELVGPLIQAGARTILVGQTGEGKTTLALQLVKAALAGDQFLDWKGAGAGRALILDLEQGKRSVKRAFRDAGLSERDDVDIALVPDGLALDRELDHVNELDEAIGLGGYTIVVIDPFYKAHQADDPNAERPIVDLMRILDALRAKYGFALILPAHPRKEPPGNNMLRKLTIADVAGSSAITRGAEIVLGIERVATGYARLRFLKDRDGDLPIGEAYNLLYNRQHGFVRDPRDLEPDRDYRAEILGIGEPAKWRTAKDWKTDIAAGEGTLKPILNDLVAEGLLVYEQGPPGRQASAKCWRLNPDLRVSSDSQDTPGHPESPLSRDDDCPGVPAYIGDTGRDSQSELPLQAQDTVDEEFDDDIPF